MVARVPCGITFRPGSDLGTARLYVVCDDGTVWARKFEAGADWVLGNKPIPGSAVTFGQGWDAVGGSDV